MTLKAICRLGDMASGTCLNHGSAQAWTGPLDSVSGGFTVNGIEAAVLDDEGLASCGHRFKVSTGSSVCTGITGKQVARVGDSVLMVIPGTGGGTLTTGSPNVSSE